MPKMRVVQVPRAGGPLELVERQIAEPGAGHVRVKVEACGICHSDAMTKEGSWPGIRYPRVPGHEIAGIIDAIGEGKHERPYDGQSHTPREYEHEALRAPPIGADREHRGDDRNRKHRDRNGQGQHVSQRLTHVRDATALPLPAARLK